jgi:SAM-dependent methyltransferase
MTAAAERCVVCGADLDPVLRPYPSSDGGTFAYAVCPACGLQRMQSPLDPAAAQQAYHEHYYGEGETKFVGWLERVRDFFAQRRARFAGSLKGSAGSVLDIGCGNGKFLALMAASGWTITGTELPGPAWARAERVPGMRLVRADEFPLPVPSASMDLVTLWHVLEHVPDPALALREARRVLKPDGALVVEVPNADSWQARCTGSRWFHLDPPRHLYQFTRRSLPRLAEQAGFAVTRTTTFSWEMGVFGFAQSLLNVLLPGRDVLYASLRTGGARRHALSRRLLSLALLAVLALPSVLWAIAESMAGAGAVVRIVARPTLHPSREIPS